MLRAMARGMPRSASQADSLAAFYAPQIDHYDRFRDRLLHGREQLVEQLVIPDNAHVVDLGGGTGRNIEFFGERAARLACFEVVDLCLPMVQRARQRSRDFAQLRATQGDATRWQPAQAVDAVILSYALTMIPNWRAAIVNAMAMLKPGGQLAVVDFYVAAPSPLDGLARHPWATRKFWPAWFRHDGVVLDDAQLPTLCSVLPNHAVTEARARIPYLPLMRVPWYAFVGRKP